jgi:hypothetical protein
MHTQTYTRARAHPHTCLHKHVQATNQCTEFSSNAFEEFGLTEVYALVSSKCDEETNYITFGYQIFRKSTCTGNPFGQVAEHFIVCSLLATHLTRIALSHAWRRLLWVWTVSHVNLCSCRASQPFLRQRPPNTPPVQSLRVIFWLAYSTSCGALWGFLGWLGVVCSTQVRSEAKRYGARGVCGAQAPVRR